MDSQTNKEYKINFICRLTSLCNVTTEKSVKIYNNNQVLKKKHFRKLTWRLFQYFVYIKWNIEMLNSFDSDYCVLLCL